MHIEILVEDASGKKLLEALLPKLLGQQGNPHGWRIHSYKGIGRVPKDLKPGADAGKRILLEQLPKILRGYGKNPGIDAVVVVADCDQRDCAAFLAELKALAAGCNAPAKTMFRLAIEEMEAWYFGDREALVKAYPRARADVLDNYVQDSICGTWEMLADAIHPRGYASIRKAGWPLPGQIKCEWAEKIGLLLEPGRNKSPSFAKLRDGLRDLAAQTASA